VLYLKGRHAEQHALIAQLYAMHGKDAAGIAEQMGIPLAKAKGAVRSPLTPGSRQAACARQLHESLYGPDAAKHRATVADYEQKEKAFRE